MRRLTRRVFLRDLGRGTVSIAVFGYLVACAAEENGSTGTTPPGTTEDLPATGSAPTTAAPAPTAAPETTTPPGTTSPQATGAVAWHRVDLGFVSAYILVRGEEAAVVDTGVGGSAPAVEAGLVAAGLGWDSVGHVILTHLHPDHIGSLADVLTKAATAAAYAGEADIPFIPSPRPLAPVGDGDRAFDLVIIATPGHTPGHISVLDPIGGLLVAGDALNGAEGGVVGPNPDFTDDMSEAEASVRKLVGFPFDTVVFGHGDPVIGGASEAVADLAAGL